MSETNALREKINAEIDQFLESGRKIKTCKAGESGKNETKPSMLYSGQKRAAMLHRARKGRITKKQLEARAYIDSKKECSVSDLKNALGTSISNARRCAEALARKRIIEIDGDKLRSV